MILPETGRWQPAWADGGAVARTELRILQNCPLHHSSVVPLPVPGGN